MSEFTNDSSAVQFFGSIETTEKVWESLKSNYETLVGAVVKDSGIDSHKARIAIKNYAIADLEGRTILSTLMGALGGQKQEAN